LREGTDFREGSTCCNLLNTINKRAEVFSGNPWITNEFDEVRDDDDSPALDLHTAIIERTLEEWDQNSQSGRCDLSDEGLVRKGFDAGRYGVGLGHAFHKGRNMRGQIGVGECGTKGGRAFDSCG